MAIKFSRNARDKMTTINNKWANLAIYGYIWLLYMVVLLATPGGGEDSAYERREDAHRKFWIKSLKEISRNSSNRFLWNFAQQRTFIQRIRSEKHFKRKCRKGLEFALEPLRCHCPKTYTIIRFSPTQCNPCIIIILQIQIHLFTYIRFKDGGCAYKNTG